MSKTDSPNSSTFDVATLIDAIHREVEGDDTLPSEEEPKVDGSQWPSSTSLKFYDDFDFIDFGDTAEEQVVVSAPEQPKLEKRGSLGKRSRGLGRSQTIKTCLCLLGEES
ncbi:expressed unknown protein [Seminavis robusta]|uniref:Uncharacterized protein n=1 Tax=Seminavis robusta TaxID=568900 RepID=A0A9N8F3G1_9STRA|nr:expressed unknown protein [Seminavis robusta]|eukprot:Sro3102_g343780.1 n/a (110) ;mRNA; r:700-1029